jgi:hypothetical protein
MARVPDIVGLTLEEALCELKEAGWAVDLKYTRPLKGDPGGEPRAVLFNVVSEHKGVLTVVCEAIGFHPLTFRGGCLYN